MKYSLLLAIALIISASGCASTDKLNQDVDQQSSQEKVRNQNELAASAKHKIETAKNLSPTERKELLNLLQKTETKMESLEANSIKLRAVLIDTLIQPGYHDDKVQLIKDKIIKAENDRMNAMIDATIEANHILAKDQGPRSDHLQWFILEGEEPTQPSPTTLP